MDNFNTELFWFIFIVFHEVFTFSNHPLKLPHISHTVYSSHELLMVWCVVRVFYQFIKNSFATFLYKYTKHLCMYVQTCVYRKEVIYGLLWFWLFSLLQSYFYFIILKFYGFVVFNFWFTLEMSALYEKINKQTKTCWNG